MSYLNNAQFPVSHHCSPGRYARVWRIIKGKVKFSLLNAEGRVLWLLLMLLCLSSCAVRQWQREHLSDPIMQLDDDEESLEMRQHILERREGSVGGQGASGGGCGC